MNHLTIEEIIDFVSISEINPETVSLSQRVNGHIRECSECLKHVQAFQLIYDELAQVRLPGELNGTDSICKNNNGNHNKRANTYAHRADRDK